MAGLLYLNQPQRSGAKRMFTTKATVQVKDSQGKVITSQEYDKVVFEGLALDEKGKPTGGTPEELLGAAIEHFQKEAGKDGNGVLELLSAATYANDLGVRAKIRQALVTAIAGPDKAIEKAVKDLMAARAAAGKPISEEAARARVKAFMED